MAAPPTTGVIDKAIHNQRIAIVDVATGQVKQVSPSDLHVYDFDWSPDDKTFVATAAPGPGDNNWWIAQIYKIDIASGQRDVDLQTVASDLPCRAGRRTGNRSPSSKES